MLRDAGWKLDHVSGSHHIYVHPSKSGTVTVPFHGSNNDLAPSIMKLIKKQMGM